MLAEERRWRDYEAAHRLDSSDSVSHAHQDTSHDPEPPARPDDPASELLRMRAERILTEAERVEMAPHPQMEARPEEEESSPREKADCSTPDAEMSPRGAGRGKYGTLMDQVGDQTPQNWETTPEEPPMQEEHTNGTPMESRARSVKLDSDSNTIDITRESRFSGQLKFSGTLIIEGEVEGELEATRVIIREGGVASARILGDSITISGKVTGDVVARHALEMTSTGRLQGDVTAPEMKLHPGAVVKGRCSIGEAA
jgi:cytoskeletal protein CcmA (bactofilin family)